MSATVVGLDAVPVSVEVDVGPGLPSFAIVGLPDAAVQEARERVRTAIRNSGFTLPARRIVVNLAPGDRRKEGPAFDLPIALAMLIATRQLAPAHLAGWLAIGELALDGTLRHVPGALAVAQAAQAIHAQRLIVPEANGSEAAIVEEVRVYAASTLRAVVEHLEEVRCLQPLPPPPWDEPSPSPCSLDLAEVRGQPGARRALEIAAAGGLNVLLVGPPGVGKTMLAHRLPTIVPPLSRAEAVEVTAISSVAGRLPAYSGLVRERPFRAPHHTATTPALIGSAGLRPGEVTLAHRGVLFLDELPEFRRDALEALRGPLEDGVVAIARAHGAVRFPARFTLVAAMNPCPCGYRGDPRRECACTPPQIQRYLARLSGPLLDRIDLHVEVPRPPTQAVLSQAPGEASEVVRARVAAARRRAVQREAGACTIATDALTFLRTAADRLDLGARAIRRVLRVARAIADLDAVEVVHVAQVAEALQYRALDRAAPGLP